MLTVSHLDLFYGDAQALDDVCLDVAAGEVVAIVGANGAGKTSLVRTVFGMQRPARGAISFEGRDIAGLPPHRTRTSASARSPKAARFFPR